MSLSPPERPHWIVAELADARGDLQRRRMAERKMQAARQRGDVDEADCQAALASAAERTLARRIAKLDSVGAVQLIEAMVASVAVGKKDAFSELLPCLRIPEPGGA